MLQEFKGKLQYMGWFNLPWKLIMGNEQIDLWSIVDSFFTSLNGKNAKQEESLNGFVLSADENSKEQFEYIPNKRVLLNASDGFGFSNVQAYLDEALIRFSGRMVNIKVEDGKNIEFAVDKSEKVFGVYYVGEGNTCKVPKGAEKTVCKIGESDCCIFLSLGSNGFRCLKFSGSPMAGVLLDRLAKGTIRATRIGDCALLGRK